MKEDSRRIKVEAGEVFLIGTQKLSFSQVKRMRTSLEVKIRRYRRKQQGLEARIIEIAETIGELEKELEGYNIPELREWINAKEEEIELQKAIEKEQKKLAKKKAKQLLKEYMGEEEYSNFKKQGFIEFRGKDNRTYSIHANGNLFRDSRPLCLIRPKNLPTSDFIIAVLTTIKEKGYGR